MNKSKNTFLVVALKLSNIVEYGRLNLYTAQHVLKHGGLPGIPDAGRQGVHREFSLDQAVRFALATKLVMAGVPVKYVARVVGFCEKHVRAYSTDWKVGPRLYKSTASDPWRLQMRDEHLVQVSRRKDHQHFPYERYYAFAKDEVVSCQETPKDVYPISEHWINVTLLEQELTVYE